ncbi:MAG: outer membrane beta-barrel protein [Saprospiraceae bacterium]|nr:outer membrane beta-barrel protein [Saprospiraceae bacterium]
MNKFLFIICFFCLSSNVSGQKYYVFAGGNASGLHHTSSDNKFTKGFDNFHFDYCFGIDISEIYLGKWPFLVNFRFEKTRGNIDFSKSANGFFNFINHYSEVSQSAIGLGFYPINVNIRKNFFIHLGGETSVNISGQLSDENDYKTFFEYGTSVQSASSDQSVFRSFNAGLSAMFSYDLPVNEKLTISPRFRVYVGLTNELRNDVINSSLRTMSYEMVFKYIP